MPRTTPSCRWGDGRTNIGRPYLHAHARVRELPRLSITFTIPMQALTQ